MEYKIKKTPTESQRLRAALYILWESKPEPKPDSEKYYHDRMEEIIQAVINKIPKND